MGSGFDDLDAYRLAAQLGDDLWERVQRWRSFARWSLGMQLVRAADSIGANIAEASGRWHRADERRLLLIARGSLHETEHWLNRAEERGLVARDTSARIDGVGKTLNGLIRRRS